jgi:amino acid transporter
VGETSGSLKRHFGLWQATALNVTMVVGAGIFITIPPMLEHVPGPAALLAWLAVGALVLVDCLVWSELGAALPGSGGSFVYLLEAYGPRSWGRLMAFLFIWQFLLSGPLELASGLIAVDSFAGSLSPTLAAWNAEWTRTWDIWPEARTRGFSIAFHIAHWTWKWDIRLENQLSMTFSPIRLGCAALGAGLIVLLYRRIENLGRLTLLFGAGVLVAAAWILVEGAWTFDPHLAFPVPMPGDVPNAPPLFDRFGAAMVLALYCYLGYYNICYIGDEVRDPGRTIPRAILLSAVFVGLLFVALHLAMIGSVPWWQALSAYTTHKESYNLPAAFMEQAHGQRAVQLLMVLLIVSCLASAFSGLLGYSRIPFGAARTGHFFAWFGRVHPRHRIPHVALLFVGGLTLLWSFFDLQTVINALVSTRLLVQFVAQAVGVMLLRRRQPSLARPFRMPLYPLPCLLAAAGWLALWLATGWLYVGLSLLTLAAGAVVFLIWSLCSRTWPFAAAG